MRDPDGGYIHYTQPHARLLRDGHTTSCWCNHPEAHIPEEEQKIAWMAGCSRGLQEAYLKQIPDFLSESALSDIRNRITTHAADEAEALVDRYFNPEVFKPKVEQGIPARGQDELTLYAVFHTEVSDFGMVKSTGVEFCSTFELAYNIAKTYKKNGIEEGAIVCRMTQVVPVAHD